MTSYEFEKAAKNAVIQTLSENISIDQLDIVCLAQGLGCTDPVSSPTFAIVNYYRGPRPLAHFDLYRISTETDLCAAGFYDYLDQGAVVAAEWSENFADLLALEDPIRVDIQRVDENTRRITIEGVTL